MAKARKKPTLVEWLVAIVIIAIPAVMCVDIIRYQGLQVSVEGSQLVIIPMVEGSHLVDNRVEMVSSLNKRYVYHESIGKLGEYDPVKLNLAKFLSTDGKHTPFDPLREKPRFVTVEGKWSHDGSKGILRGRLITWSRWWKVVSKYW